MTDMLTNADGVFDIERARIRQGVLNQLILDLRRPPEWFPEFNMDYHYYVDEDGTQYGDVAAFIVARVLGEDRSLQYFVADGGDVIATAMDHAGLSARHIAMLVLPSCLLELDYPLHTITGNEAAELVDSFIESGYMEPDYTAIVESIHDLDEHSPTDDDYDLDSIGMRVDRFMMRYGGRIN